MTKLRLSRLRRIRLISRILKSIAFAGVALFAVLYVVAFTMPEGIAAVVHSVTGKSMPGGLTTGHLVVLFAIGAVPFGLFLAAVVSAGQLFRAFEKGCILDPLAGGLVCRIGIFVLLSEVAGIFAGAAATAYMSAQTGVGSGTVTISTNNLAGFLLGALILVVGWVIAEAADIAEENRQIV